MKKRFSLVTAQIEAWHQYRSEKDYFMLGVSTSSMPFVLLFDLICWLVNLYQVPFWLIGRTAALLTR